MWCSGALSQAAVVSGCSIAMVVLAARLMTKVVDTLFLCLAHAHVALARALTSLCRCAGGFKLWEGAVDLAAYLAREHGLTAEAVTARELQSSSGLQVNAGDGDSACLRLKGEFSLYSFGLNLNARLNVYTVFSRACECWS